MSNFKNVSRDEFISYVENYPRPLERDRWGARTPSLVSYNDFTRGVWPESIVAQHSYEDLDETIPADYKVRNE